MVLQEHTTFILESFLFRPPVPREQPGSSVRIFAETERSLAKVLLKPFCELQLTNAEILLCSEHCLECQAQSGASLGRGISGKSLDRNIASRQSFAHPFSGSTRLHSLQSGTAIFFPSERTRRSRSPTNTSL
ncbi:MAG: hypothetical protein ACD_50C00345G0004 [uncultured bacterium]|nr:MAG: hypothetical protein ACD_50C00345G0004 [uncultured bacterium]